MDQKPSDQAMKDQAALMSFIEGLIKDKKDPNITQQSMPQVKAMLLTQLNEAINTHLVNMLSEKDQIELDDLLNKNPSDDELNAFFKSRIPNLEPEIASAMLNFRAAYLGDAAGSSNGNGTPPTPPPPAPVAPESN